MALTVGTTSGNTSLDYSVKKQGGKWVVNVGGQERSFWNQATAEKYVNHALKNRALDIAKLNEQSYRHNASSIDNQFGNYGKGGTHNLRGAARKAYEAKYERDLLKAFEEQDNALRKSVTDADFTTHYGDAEKLRKKAPLGDVTKNKSKGNIFQRLGNWVGKTWKSGPKGKAGLIAAGLTGLGALAAGAIALFGGKKAEETTTVQTQQAQATEEQAKEVTENAEPSADAANKQQAAPAFPLDENGQYTVKQGDVVWNIAKDYLASKKPAGAPEPTPQEIMKEVDRIMSINPQLKWLPNGDIQKWFVKIVKDQKIQIENKLNVAA